MTVSYTYMTVTTTAGNIKFNLLQTSWEMKMIFIYLIMIMVCMPTETDTYMYYTNDVQISITHVTNSVYLLF